MEYFFRPSKLVVIPGPEVAALLVDVVVIFPEVKSVIGDYLVTAAVLVPEVALGYWVFPLRIFLIRRSCGAW